jgi:hypothetical protein
VGLAYAKLDTHHGLLTASLAGDVGLAFVAAPGGKPSSCPGSRRPGDVLSAVDGASRVFQAAPGALGSEESAAAAEHTLKFKAGDALIAWSGPPATATSGATPCAAADVGKIVAATFQGRSDLSVTDRAAVVGEKLAAQSPGAWAALVLRRR